MKPEDGLFSLSSYHYELPPELIAQTPAKVRDQSRLLVLDRARGSWTHRLFSDLPSILDEQDVLVANNTRVLKARLRGRRVLADGSIGGKIEFLMLEELRPLVWEGAFRSTARQKPGLRFEVPTPDGMGLKGVLIRGSEESPSRTVVVEFDRDPVKSDAGEIPLPHYMARAPDSDDLERYQTVYAKSAGSAAAPTAGLHFTPQIRERLEARGVGWEEVTLHVGLGTFRPVQVDDIRNHVMHEERYTISEECAARIHKARAQGKRIVAVGTTSVRTLESAADDLGRVQPGHGRTSIFIHPSGRPIRVVNRLITNFHLPGSTLLMLVSAFAGRELVLEAYRDAVREKYRFFSYGDAMLIL